MFVLAVLLIGLSGVAAADNALDVSASVSAAAVAIGSPSVPVLDNGSLSANDSVSGNGTITPVADGRPGLHPGLNRIRENPNEVRARIKAVQETAKAHADALRQRAKDVRENVKERVQQITEDQKERKDQTREKIQDLRQMGKAKLEQLRSERQKNVEHARDLEANLAAKVKALHDKGPLNETEKTELKAQANFQVKAAYDHRVELAKRLEAEGANSTLVADFVSFSKTNWNQYANATNASAKKDLLVQFNQRWNQFRQAVVKDVMVAKVRMAVNESRQALVRLQAVVTKLSAAGFNTTGLSNESAFLSVRLDSVLSASDLPTAVAQLRQVHAALVHLRNGIQHTVNHELVEGYRADALPSVTVDAALAINAGGSLTSSGSDDLGVPVASTSDSAAGATAVPSTPPTNGTGSASASISTSVATSANGSV